MNIDEQLSIDSADPAMVELRRWRDEQRAPLSAEELERVCEAASQAAAHRAMLHIRMAVRAQLRIVISNELLIFVIGIAIGMIAGKLIIL
jgi:hypothetical protein